MIRAFFSYASYVIRHKWFVFVACWKQGLIWRGLVHDLSKFRPDEWFPYMCYFNLPKGHRRHSEKAFDEAWLRHIHRNPHHWQHWILQEDSPVNPRGEPKVLEMPKKYWEEMVCDWIGAGLAQGHGYDVRPWYDKSKSKIKLHAATRDFVEEVIGHHWAKLAEERKDGGAGDR